MYCNEIGNTLDHVIPHSLSARFGTTRSYEKQLVVPCCKECNGILGNRGASLEGEFTVASKAEYLYNYYLHKYKSYIEGEKGKFTNTEIRKFKGKLREQIKYDKKRRREISYRMKHLKIVASMKDLNVKDIWETIDEGSIEILHEDMKVLMKSNGSVVVVKDFHYVTDYVEISGRLGCPAWMIQDVLAGLDVEDLEVSIGKPGEFD